jgi:hypothetical protein
LSPIFEKRWMIYNFLLSFNVFDGTGLDLRPSNLFGCYSTSWITIPALFVLIILKKGCTFPKAGLDHNPSVYSFYGSWDDRGGPLCPATDWDTVSLVNFLPRMPLNHDPSDLCSYVVRIISMSNRCPTSFIFLQIWA